MHIAIIGAGNVGGTLGRRWAALGHSVVFGVRDPGREAGAVKGGAPSEVMPSTVSYATPREAVRGADAVVLTTPWAAVPTVLAEIGATTGALDGVPLLDATNPFSPGFRLDVGPNGASGAERVQEWAPGARVVKIFNTTGYDNMRDPRYDGAPTVMFLAGDSESANATAMALSNALGFETIVAGPLVRARELEHLALLWISLAVGGHGRDIAFRLVRR